jgi:cell wall-associated NlpC family hydrolase
MPLLGLAMKSLLLSLADDALRLLVPLGVGLGLLLLLLTQGVAADSLATAGTRAEYLRPMIVVISSRSGQPATDAAGAPIFHQAIPAALLMAIAEQLSDFDPTRGCTNPTPDGRRGLMGVRPSEYDQYQLTGQRLLGRALTLPIERGLCQAEANLVVASSRLARLYLARQSEMIFENQRYQAALDEYHHQLARQQRCLAEQTGQPPAAAPPGQPASPCPEPDRRLLEPPPACLERYGRPNPRSPQRPTHQADWEDAETVCRLAQHYADTLSYPRLWSAQASWRQVLRHPLQPASGRPTGDEPAEAPGGSHGYAIGEAVRYARAQLGKPYQFGAPVDLTDPSPAAFDCSGLVQWAYGQAGLQLPRTAEAQYRATRRLAYDQLQPGDLVFFCCDPDQPWTRVSHVGIYVGSGQMLDAPAPGRPVRLEPVWLNDYIGGGRLVEAGR